MEKNNSNDVFHIQIKESKSPTTANGSQPKTVQIKVGNNKTVLVYNRASSYIVDSLFRAVFKNVD